MTNKKARVDVSTRAFFHAKRGLMNFSGYLLIYNYSRYSRLLMTILLRFFAIFALLNYAHEFLPSYSIRCMHDHGVIHTGAGLLKA